MSIKVTCPTCARTYAVPDDRAARPLKCPECGGRIPATAPTRPTEPAPRPAPTPRPVEPEERGAYARLVWYAAAIRMVVNVLMYPVALGSAVLFFLGVRSGHAVEAVVIVVLALVQSSLALLGTHLLEQFALAFVWMAKDTQVIRQSLSKK